MVKSSKSINIAYLLSINYFVFVIKNSASVIFLQFSDLLYLIFRRFIYIYVHIHTHTRAHTHISLVYE